MPLCLCRSDASSLRRLRKSDPPRKTPLFPCALGKSRSVSRRFGRSPESVSPSHAVGRWFASRSYWAAWRWLANTRRELRCSAYCLEARPGLLVVLQGRLSCSAVCVCSVPSVLSACGGGLRGISSYCVVGRELHHDQGNFAAKLGRMVLFDCSVSP
jgi:hypothetical protein